MYGVLFNLVGTMEESTTDGENALKDLSRKKKGVLFVVFCFTIGLHVIAGVVAGLIVIVNDIIEEAEDFELAPVVVAPQKKPEYQVNLVKLKKQSAPPRPRPIVVHNPNNINLPALDIPKIDTIQAKDLNVLDALSMRYIIMPKEAIEVIKNTFLQAKASTKVSAK